MPPTTTTATFSIVKLLGKLVALLIFAVLTGLGVRSIPTNSRVGWFATILFGVMCVVAVFEIIRICGLDADKIPDVKAELNVRNALVYVGMLVVTFVLGVTDNFISESFTQSFPRPGVWLGTFLTTLVFYPLREDKKTYWNFRFWAIFCALLGVVSVGISYVKDWIDQLL